MDGLTLLNRVKVAKSDENRYSNYRVSKNLFIFFKNADFTKKQFHGIQNLNFGLDYSFRQSELCFLANLAFFSGCYFLKIKFESLWNIKNGSFSGFKIAKFDFTQNLCGRKIVKIPHFAFWFHWNWFHVKSEWQEKYLDFLIVPILLFTFWYFTVYTLY